MRLYKTEGEGGRGNKGAIRCEALCCDCTKNHIMVLLTTALSVQRKLHGKDQIAIPKINMINNLCSPTVEK